MKLVTTTTKASSSTRLQAGARMQHTIAQPISWKQTSYGLMQSEIIVASITTWDAMWQRQAPCRTIAWFLRIEAGLLTRRPGVAGNGALVAQTPTIARISRTIGRVGGRRLRRTGAANMNPIFAQRQQWHCWRHQRRKIDSTLIICFMSPTELAPQGVQPLWLFFFFQMMPPSIFERGWERMK